MRIGMLRRVIDLRVLLGIVIVLAVLAVALWPEITEVEVATVEHGRLQITVDEEGETRVRERFVVSAPVTGRLQRIEFEPGDRVSRSMVLASLVPVEPTLLDSRSRAELEGAVEAAQATLGQARAEREATEQRLRRRFTVARESGHLPDEPDTPSP